ncbi:hypothetical protein [Turneriella parva]|uniref:Cell division protein FtsX n=1 Tax=Turneriella parva (strain ATCC BAA-1111 / DSM 21527 / NCTC 11395 / H) TaxID=869212 RepID=I4B4U6_TURPD|nr:hypothetical protein [Turneriella parva]AFM12303.1 hypothetical protein Turpa_1655 [Turneriella parva DSM 21527]
MTMIKWLTVVILCAALAAGAAMAAVFVAIDRSLGSTEYLSNFIQGQKFGEIAQAAENSAKADGAPSQLAVISKLGYSVLEPEFKKQSRSMLDQLFAYLKGDQEKPSLTMSLSDFKQDPGVLKSAVDGLMQNETMKKLPRSFVEPAAKMLVEKVPEKLNLTSLLTSRESDLAQVKKTVGKFYQSYNAVLLILIAVLILTFIVLRSVRQTLIAVGITLLITGLLLFLPWLASGSIAQSIVSGYKGVAAESVQSIGAAFIKSFFAVFVVSPLVLTLAGAAAYVTGKFVMKKAGKT